jgi:hypothetical protein
VGNTHFVLFDDFAVSQMTSGIAPLDLATAQLAWLASDLAAANADRVTHPFIVAISHRGIYSTSKHSADPDVLATRSQLAPLFDRFGADLVINGHDHEYERSFALHAGNPPDGPPVVGAGTTYVTCAGAGAEPYAVGSTPGSFSAKQVAYGSASTSASMAYAGVYGLLTLSGRTLTLTAYGLKPSSTTVAGDDVIDSLVLTH